MKLFIARFCLFISILLLLSFAADKVVTNLLRQSKQLEYGVWNDLLMGHVNADIIIHGSSRAWVQVDPAIFESELGQSTYNLGIDAFGFHMQYCRHLLSLKNNKKPNTIIHVLDYSLFDKAEVLYNPEQFFPYLNDSIINTSIASYKGISIAEKEIPFLRYAGKNRSLRHAGKILLYPQFNKPDRFKGFQPQHQSWNNDLQNARDNLKNNYYEPVDSAIVDLFRNYIADCKRKNIHVILVYPPEYIQGQDFVRNRKDILTLFQRIASQYNIDYLDYSNHPISYERKYFYNTEHLNAEGSTLFTKALIDDIRQHLGK